MTVPQRLAWRATGGDREAPSPAEAARRLVEMAERLAPCWERPERWHEGKSELIAACRRLARTLEGITTNAR